MSSIGRGDVIRTHDLTVPNGARYRAAPHPDMFRISVYHKVILKVVHVYYKHRWYDNI